MLRLKSPGSTSTVLCSKCGKTNHTHITCPSQKTCYKCKQVGHLGKDCTVVQEQLTPSIREQRAFAKHYESDSTGKNTFLIHRRIDKDDAELKKGQVQVETRKRYLDSPSLRDDPLTGRNRGTSMDMEPATSHYKCMRPSSHGDRTSRTDDPCLVPPGTCTLPIRRFLMVTNLEDPKNTSVQHNLQRTVYSLYSKAVGSIPANVDVVFENITWTIPEHMAQLDSKLSVPESFFSFGRLDSCSYTLATPTVSRIHALIFHCGDRVVDKATPHCSSIGLYITDQRSTYGTFVNEHQIPDGETRALEIGSTIRFGEDASEFVIVEDIYLKNSV